MRLGLERGTVALVSHDPAWKTEAACMIQQLWGAFGAAAKDIQHIGSTAVRHIKAKPVIDIAIAVDHFACLPEIMPKLAAIGVDKSAGQPFPGIVLCSVDDASGLRTHNIQIMMVGSTHWLGHILLRDYLNSMPQGAKAYEKLKEELAKKHPHDLGAYSAGKIAFIKECMKEAMESHDE